jgi:translation elongation factor EF-G
MLDAVCKMPSQWIKIVLKEFILMMRLLEEDQTKIMRKPDVKEPFAALAFKIATDPFWDVWLFPCLFRTFRCRFLCLEHAFRK